jgi:hypothetical protein
MADTWLSGPRGTLGDRLTERQCKSDDRLFVHTCAPGCHFTRFSGWLFRTSSWSVATLPCPLQIREWSPRHDDGWSVIQLRGRVILEIAIAPN